MAINNITGFPGNQSSRTGESSSTQGGRRKEGAESTQGGSATSSGSGAGDSVSLTETATRLKALEGALAKQPVVDTSNVKAIQKALADGSYELDNRRLAQKLVNFEKTLNR